MRDPRYDIHFEPLVSTSFGAEGVPIACHLSEKVAGANTCHCDESR